MEFEFLGEITEATKSPSANGEAGRRASRSDIERQIQLRLKEWNTFGLSKRAMVLLVGENSIDFFVDLLALWTIDCCVLPLPSQTPRYEIDQLITKTSADFIIFAGGSLVAVRADAGRVSLPDSLINIECATEIAGLVLLTSGSSGLPKLVVHSVANVLRKIARLREVISSEESSQTLCFLSTSFGHGLICNSLFPLLSGNSLHIAQTADLDIFRSIRTYIDSNRITFLSSVPAVWPMIFAAPEQHQRTLLRRVHCASAPAPGQLFEKIQTWSGTHNVWNVYGLTEFAGWVSGAKWSPTDIEPQVGKGWSCEVTVRGNDQQLLASPASGAVWIRSTDLMLGYWDGHSLSNPSSEGWFRTGDLGTVSSSGSVTLRGRSSSMINKAGLKILPEELEVVILTHPLVVDVCVFALPHLAAGETVGAAIVIKAGTSKEIVYEMREWCASRIAKAKIPSRWFVLPSIPRNERGKIERHVLSKIMQVKDAT